MASSIIKILLEIAKYSLKLLIIIYMSIKQILKECRNGGPIPLLLSIHLINL